jgi:hypothetical protein
VTAPLISAAFTSYITRFAPEQDCAGLAISAIDPARVEVLVNAYVFTTGSGIRAAPIRARHQDVDVRLFVDQYLPELAPNSNTCCRID